MTINLTKLLGIQIRISRGSDDKRYMHAVIWYPRSAHRYGYLYPSIRWF